MATITKTETFYISEFISSSSSGYTVPSSTYPATKPIGQDPNTASSYARLGTTSRAAAILFYGFDLSTIPEDAKIESVTGIARANISSKSGDTRTIQFFSGTTEKGSSKNMATSYSTITNMGDLGTWTREELEDAQIRFYYKANSTNTLYIRGASITVTYSYEAEDSTSALYVKENSTWKQYSKAYKKIDGTWVEQSDLANVFDTETKYVRT